MVGTYARIPASGEWLIRLPHGAGREGATVTVRRKDGRFTRHVLGRKVAAAGDSEYWAIDDSIERRPHVGTPVPGARFVWGRSESPDDRYHVGQAIREGHKLFVVIAEGVTYMPALNEWRKWASLAEQPELVP